MNKRGAPRCREEGRDGGGGDGAIMDASKTGRRGRECREFEREALSQCAAIVTLDADMK